jgi:hypothetical protein
MQDAVLTDLEVEQGDYAVTRQTYTVEPNKGCLVTIKSGFNDATQTGSF